MRNLKSGSPKIMGKLSWQEEEKIIEIENIFPGLLHNVTQCPIPSLLHTTEHNQRKRKKKKCLILFVQLVHTLRNKGFVILIVYIQSKCNNLFKM
jgi:hypothetical protein